MWERTVDGRVLSFRLAGINNQNFIMQDRETGSWWQQVSGQAVQGPLKGKQLTRVFHDELSFAAWSGEQPGGRVLRPASDTAWKRFSDNWEEKTSRAPVRVHTTPDQRLKPRAVVLGVDFGGSAKAYPEERVLAQAPLHDRVGAQPLVLFVGADGKSVRGFDPRVDSHELEFIRPTGGQAGELQDVATGSTWSFSGLAIAGPLKGRQLQPLYVLKDFWFDWFTYHRATAVYQLGPS